MTEKDGETWYAYFLFSKLGWKPSEFIELSIKERALIIAFIQEYQEQKRKENSKIKKK